MNFRHLNLDWNADPNAPDPVAEVDGGDVVLRFFVNSLMFDEFGSQDIGILRFVHSEKYRLGATNDEGWYLGQCRFSKLAPKWGEFYEVEGDAALLDLPQDWIHLVPAKVDTRHFLFYFRDNTFECVSKECVIEPRRENSLHGLRKKLGA